MSLFSYPFGREAPIKKILTTSVTTTLYTAGNNGAVVVAMRLVEAASTSSQTATLTVVDTSSVAYRVDYKAFAVNERHEPVTLNGVPIVLLPGEALKITNGGATSVHATGVVVEPDQRA